jgi:hypothetical protein
MAANLTITVDTEALRRARIRALSQGTSVNALLRDYLHAYAGVEEEHHQALSRILELAEASKGGSAGASWKRDELHDRTL